MDREREPTPPRGANGRPPGRRLTRRTLLLGRVALLVPVLVAAFVLHVSGTALVVLHLVRVALVVAILVAGGRLRSRAARRGA